jgi:hypothetical protein
MAKGIFLANPDLNKDNVDLSASSQLGRRAGAPTAFANNSNLLNVTTIGDPGDDLTHDFQIFGSQNLPTYSPLTSGGALQYAAPESFTSLGTVACGAAAKVALAMATDRMYAVVADGSVLKVFVYDGAGPFTLKTSISVLTNSAGGISASAMGENIYIVVANNTDGVVELYRYNTTSNTLGTYTDALIATDSTVYGIAFANNGTLFMLLVTRTSGGNKDVDIYFGHFGDMTKNDATINDLFGTSWVSGGDVRACAVTFATAYGFVAAFRSGTTGAAGLKLLTSTNGADWQEFKDYKKAIVQPTISTPWADDLNCAITVEYRRVFVYRPTAAALNGAPTDIKMQWFNGKVWSAELDADNSIAVNAGTQMGAAQWRGMMFYAWRSTAATIMFCRNNELTTSNTGYYRELTLGEQMFVAGIDDDSQTALFFIATGSIRAGDEFRIQAGEFDYRVVHLLDDFLSKVWRGADGAEQTIVFDAGSGRGFLLDAIALFRTNLPSITVEMSDDVAFGTIPVSQAISATVKTATVVSVDRNYVTFAADTFTGEQYSGGAFRYWVFFSGGSVGVLRVLGNTTNRLIVDGSASGASGTATIFRDTMGYLFTNPVGAYRYLRLITPTVTLPDGFYEISRVLFGLSFVPPIDYRIEWLRRYGQQQGRVELKDGARFNTLLNLFQRPAWTLTFRHKIELIQPVVDFFGYVRGGVRLFGFWPNPTALTGNQTEVHPMYFTQDPPEMTDLGGGASELACVVEGQI